MTPERIAELRLLSKPIEVHMDGGRLQECLNEIDRLNLALDRWIEEAGDVALEKNQLKDKWEHEADRADKLEAEIVRLTKRLEHHDRS